VVNGETPPSNAVRNAVGEIGTLLLRLAIAASGAALLFAVIVAFGDLGDLTDIHPEDAGSVTIVLGAFAVVMSIPALILAIVLRLFTQVSSKISLTLLCMALVSLLTVGFGFVVSYEACHGTDYGRYRCGVDEW
jgi:hypothetical protein